MRHVVATRLLTFNEVVAGWHIIRIGAGPRNDPTILALQQRPDYRKHRGLAPQNWAAAPNQFRIVHRTRTGIHTIDLAETHENYAYAQPLEPQQWLVVRARADHETDYNAHIYTSTGRLLTSFYAGDAIDEIYTTTDGGIWIRFFDEGMFGNLKLSSSGIVCLDRRGNLTFDYLNAAQRYALPPVWTCGAMNVAASEEVWLKADTLIRVRKRRVDRIWKAAHVEDVMGFAITEHWALFALDRLDPILRLQALTTTRAESFQPVDDRGAPIHYRSAFGRGPRLYLVTDEDLFRINIFELAR